MKKSSLFISAALTTFVLAVLAGSITAYRSLVGSTQAGAVQQSAPLVQVAADSLTPQQASQVAAQYLARNDLYSVETSLLNDMSVYMVTFSSGDVVYVSPDGQVLSVAYAPLLMPPGSSQTIQTSPVQPIFGSEHEAEDDND